MGVEGIVTIESFVRTKLGNEGRHVEQTKVKRRKANRSFEKTNMNIQHEKQHRNEEET
jgi:hypothetical protein